MQWYSNYGGHYRVSEWRFWHSKNIAHTSVSSLLRQGTKMSTCHCFSYSIIFSGSLMVPHSGELNQICHRRADDEYVLSQHKDIYIQIIAFHILTSSFLLIHIITKYESSSSVSCMLLLMSFQRWRSWETQYPSTDTVPENIPINLSPFRVSRDTQKEATLIQSSMQWELMLRVLMVECSRRPLVPSLVICAPISYGLPSLALTVPSFCVQITDHNQLYNKWFL